MGYKQSKYNFFFDAEDGTHLAFNAMSGGFARIKDENWEEIQRVLKNPNNCKIEKENRLRQSLIKGRFLIEEDVNEIDILKVRNRLGRFNASTLMLTIAPTLACNFKCIYCYENQGRAKKQYMSNASKKNLVEFIGFF
jgi:uncharacterized protein